MVVSVVSPGNSGSAAVPPIVIDQNEILRRANHVFPRLDPFQSFEGPTDQRIELFRLGVEAIEKSWGLFQSIRLNSPKALALGDVDKETMLFVTDKSSFVASLYGHDSLRLDKMVKQMGDAFASVLRLWIDAHTDPSIKIESKYKMSEGSFVRLKELLQAKAARQATDIYDYIGRGFITGLRSILASAGTIETSFKQQYHRRPAQWEFTQLLSQIIEFHKRMATSSFQFFLKYTSESMLPQIFGATCYPGLFEVVRTKGRYYWQLTERFRKALAATAEALERAESDDDQIDYITGCPITYARSINCEGSSRNVLSEFMEWIITSMQILYICDLPRRAFREKKS